MELNQHFQQRHATDQMYRTNLWFNSCSKTLEAKNWFRTQIPYSLCEENDATCDLLTLTSDWTKPTEGRCYIYTTLYIRYVKLTTMTRNKAGSLKKCLQRKIKKSLLEKTGCWYLVLIFMSCLEDDQCVKM